MSAIIESVETRRNKANAYITEQERSNNKKLTQLKKQQERASRESSNRGGKTKLREEARTRIILEESDGEQAETDTREQESISNIGVKSKRIVLKRIKRKQGHRDDACTTRF